MSQRSLAAKFGLVIGLLALAACGPGGGGGSQQENSGHGSAAGDPERGGTAGASGEQSDGEGRGGSSSGGGTGGVGGAGSDTKGVELVLERLHPGATAISFGVPVPHGALKDVSTVRVLIDGAAAAARVSETLPELDGSGARIGVRAFRVELSASLMTADSLVLKLDWGGEPGQTSATITPYGSEAISVEAPATVTTVTRTIQSVNGNFALVEGAKADKTLFVGREPRIVARFPAGYLASTGILGAQRDRSATSSGPLSGLKFVSDQFAAFTDSSIYREKYALNPHPDSVTDELTDYSAWLYDRCATYLNAYLHHGDLGYLRQAYKACSFYAGKIGQSGEWAGLFTGKPYPDTKYSHLRGLYAYYALTGDEQALQAGKSIAQMWLNNPYFVKPYREGHTPGTDKLWTERLLATSLEALVYGYQLTGDTSYLLGLEEMMNTAFSHVTGDAAALAKINPGVSLPPQNCFIHSGLQQSEEGPTDPWCSPWMSAMLVDPMSEYQRLTGDQRVDEIFVRLGRFLRDVGTAYFTKDLHDDSFMQPSVCDLPSAGEDRRRLVPLYGAGIDAAGVRKNFGEWSDFEHCADASALAAAASAALKRSGGWDQNPVGSFASEGESFQALHQELLACAQRTFVEHTRDKRDPSSWTSAELSAGAADPATFINESRIGFPLHVQIPRRKLSWWFNAAMLELGILSDAGLSVTSVQSGFIQPPGC